jgi:hypothetical protein
MYEEILKLEIPVYKEYELASLPTHRYALRSNGVLC